MIKESDIRPIKLVKEQQKYISADRERLLQFQDEFVFVNCPACGLNLSIEHFIKNGLNYVLCTNCGTIYINPRPTPKILEYCLSNSDVYAYWNQYMFPQSETKRREFIFKPRAQKVAEICMKVGIQGGTLVEVGAGFGIFCEEIKKYNIFNRVIAIEPTLDLANTCRLKGIEVINSPVEKVQLEKESVDIIINFEVIEHLFSPLNFINLCSDLLKPNGIILLTCPNGEGFEPLMLKEKADTFDHEHLNYFNPSSIKHLFLSLNFEIIEISTPGKLDVDIVHNKILSGDFDISSNEFFNYIFMRKFESLKDNLQLFLSDNNISTHMLIVAKKREF